MFFFYVSLYDFLILVQIYPQLLWLEMALFSKTALRNIEKHS